MYQGFYINLARNQTRRLALERHLEEQGAAARYRRFEAVDGRAVAHQYPPTIDPGNLGCSLSHVGVVQANRGLGSHLHILEDDAIFAQGAVPLFEQILRAAETQLGAWDVILTDIFVSADLGVFRLFAEKMDLFAKTGTVTLINLQHIRFACLSSYFINRNSIDKFLDLMANNWTTGVPGDLHFRNIVNQGKLTAFTTVPFLTSVSDDSLVSDIRGNLNRTRLVYNTYRLGFFKDANLELLQRQMQELTKAARIPPLAALFREAVTFVLSDQFETF